MPKVLKIYMQPAFLMCAAVLAASGVGMPVAIEKFGVYLQKEPLPLKKPLDFLDEKGLGPYRVLSKEKIDNPEVIKNLGTKEYIQWTLEDTEVGAESSVRQCSLFVTYYELPDRVPHVPEECYIGSGYQKLSGDSLTVIAEGEGDKREIPVKYLVFTSKNQSSWRRDTQFSVLYLFKVNGDFANSRESARIALNKNIRYKYSYFSKVEWKFFNTRLGVTVNPTKSESISASGKLLGVILPILEGEHWPDWTR
jgi:hypothetical protein